MACGKKCLLLSILTCKWVIMSLETFIYNLFIHFCTKELEIWKYIYMKKEHISCLELEAGFLVLKCFLPALRHHMLVHLDNGVMFRYISHQVTKALHKSISGGFTQSQSQWEKLTCQAKTMLQQTRWRQCVYPEESCLYPEMLYLIRHMDCLCKRNWTKICKSSRNVDFFSYSHVYVGESACLFLYVFLSIFIYNFSEL